MATTVYVMRHAEQKMEPGKGVWQPEARLIPGARTRIEVAARYFQSEGLSFTSFNHSELDRSERTCRLLYDFMGSNAAEPLLRNYLGPGHMSEWEREYKAWRLKQDDQENPPEIPSSDWLRLFYRLCRLEGERALTGVRDIANDLQDGESAVAVSHNPMIQFAQCAASGNWQIDTPALGFCDIVAFTFDGKNFLDSREIRL